jgi:hypothetical protein
MVVHPAAGKPPVFTGLALEGRRGSSLGPERAPAYEPGPEAACSRA